MDTEITTVATGAEDERAFVIAFDAFTRAVRRARGARGSQPRSPSHGLTLSQYALLETLAEADVARVAQLAEEAGITASTATRILDALERRGIVARQRDEDDRRAVAVTLTPQGRDLLVGQQQWVSDRKRRFVQELSDEQRAVLPELMHALAALIDELAAGPES
ncbi:MAG TPA: MarR family transcriptional regulator [Solirubrobacteraceae bacterium]|jgi:DNA-binding MarR family transcriptional regulator|nr:MarR family transcriptional regulator [Solirubrobacteraceae bacterium]